MLEAYSLQLIPVKGRWSSALWAMGREESILPPLLSCWVNARLKLLIWTHPGCVCGPDHRGCMWVCVRARKGMWFW